MIFINDGSRDNTWAILDDLAAADPRLVLVNLSRNHGHQLALTAGLSLCRGSRVLIIDADLQDPPELLARMLLLMDAGADVVYGRRRRRRGESAFKIFTASLFYLIIGLLSDVPLPWDAGDFRLISRRVLEVLSMMPERHRFVRGMVSWIGFSQVPIDFERDSRYAGRTKYSVSKMVRLAADAITASSTRPLLLPVVLAAVSAVVGATLLVCATFGRLSGGTGGIWPFALGVASLFGAGNFLALGILGVYVGRLYQQAIGRPLFVVERVVRRYAPEG
jgi:dolichol-phosphate mannosyltransferase